MFKSPSLLMSLTAVAVLTACSSSPQVDPNQRAILVSIDALNEAILREHLSAEQAPGLFQIFDQGACTEYAQPMFPSVTAAGHASIWTGAYGDVHNITANAAHVLPRDQNTAMATISGFSATNLSAEPIWITAGYSGKSVGGHHATQGPGEAGFQPRRGERSARQQADFERVVEGYTMPSVQVMNGYNEQIDGHGVLSGSDVEWTDNREWRNLRSLGVTMEPKAFTFTNRAGTFYGLVYGSNRYDRIAISTSPDINQAVIAVAQPVESESFADRTLARHFSEPLAVNTDSGRTYLRARLFEISSNGEDFMLYHTPMHIMDTNHSDVQSAYNDYVQGWFGNSATRVYTDGGFGPTRFQGGDGTAEKRYLETAELLTRVFNKGSSFFWQQQQVELLVDYFPLGDAIDHSVLTYMDSQWPGYDETIAGYMKDLRNTTWQLVDLRMQHLMDLAAAEGAATFVAGDHGMRGTWMEFRPNLLLQAAGLQVLDDNGMVDLAKSKAVAPTGTWITINTTEWRGGIVEPEDKSRVIEQVVAALQGAVDTAGNPIIDRIYLPAEHPELGIGGAAGGDIYWAEKPGYRSSRTTRGEDYAADTRPLGWHSMASTDPLMQTVTCAYGGGFTHKRAPASKLIDVAPTVSEYLGIPAPAHSRGRSLMPDLR
ncbi:MAG: alkaline phosphatase family protein [Idiomarina sp.]|nr:alkaline phosphatase family protein [Idiomarina sp.]